MTNRQKPKFKNWKQKKKKILEENMGQKVPSPGSLGKVSLDYYSEVRDSNNQCRQNWVQENFKLLRVKTDKTTKKEEIFANNTSNKELSSACIRTPTQEK